MSAAASSYVKKAPKQAKCCMTRSNSTMATLDVVWIISYWHDSWHWKELFNYVDWITMWYPSGTLPVCIQKFWIGESSSWNERAELRGEESLQTKEQHPYLVHRWFQQSRANALYKLPWGGTDSPNSAFWSFWDWKVVKMLDLNSELFMRLLWVFRPTFLGHYSMPSRKLVSKHRRPSRLAYLPCTLADMASTQFVLRSFWRFSVLIFFESVATWRRRCGRFWIKVGTSLALPRALP